jgi:hypothetical protein
MGAVMWAWKSRPDRDGQGGADQPDAAEELALAVVQVLGHHRAVQREEGGVAAAADRAHDGARPCPRSAPSHVAGRVRARRHRTTISAPRCARPVEEAAELGVRVGELRDGGLAGERPE